MTTPSKVSRSWCFTINNWTQPEYDHLVEMKTQMKKLMVGKEVAPTTGTPHLQGYLVLSQPRTRKWCSTNLCSRASWEVAKGSAEQNRTYVTKQDSDALIFEESSQGKRSDLEALYQDLKTGLTIRGALEKGVSFAHLRLVEKWHEHMGPKRPDGPRQCYWFWGPTYCGKTYDAKHEFGDSYCIIDTNEGQKTWFDAYNNEKVLILDELRPKSMSFKNLLILMDESTRWVEKKGSGCWSNWDIVVVTSPLPPHAWSDGTGWEQLERRLTVIREYSPRDVPIPKPRMEKK